MNKFARMDGEVFTGGSHNRLRSLRPCPAGVFIYKPSQRRYDYVDYTGKFNKQDVDFCDTTWLLETLGLIKFIEKIDCDQGSFA